MPDLRRTWSVARFFLGVSYPFRGIFFVIRHPSTWPFLVLPVLISAAVFATALYVAWHGVPWALTEMFGSNPEAHVDPPLIVVHTWEMFVLLLRTLAFFVVGLTLYFSAGLVAIPFIDRLSQKVEEITRGTSDDGVPGSWLGDIALSVSHSGVSALLYFGAMALLFTLEVFPGAGSLVHIATAVFLTSMFLVREMMDGAMSRRRMSYFRKLRVIARNLPMMLGFGMVAAALTWVPFMNFLVLPMLVSGGTIMFCHLEHSEMLPR